MKPTLIEIWKNKGQILEGIKNAVFKSDHVEEIARVRQIICEGCPSGLYDTTGEGCMVKGTQPCCNFLEGGCGCSIYIKTRSLSSGCPNNHWLSIISEEEEDALNQSLEN